MRVSPNIQLFYILVFIMIAGCEHAFACTGLFPNFTLSPAGCGIPKVVSIANTSTGANAATTSYIWKANGVRFDSTYGTAAPAHFAAATPGTYIFKVIARTSGGCYDSSVVISLPVTTSAPAIIDGTGNPLYNPSWTNCIVNPLAANTFDVDISSPQALASYTIHWGDASADNTGLLLPAGAVVSHTYAALGVYTVSIISLNAGCYDTIRGTVYNLRPPIPSILPVTGGTYSGCAPLNIVFRDSTLYAFQGTTITWNFGIAGAVFTRDYLRANDTINYTYALSSALATCPKTITLTVANPQCGSPVTSSLLGFVNVFNKSAAAINPPTALCQASRTYTFSNTSTNNCVGSDRYFWKTSDSTVGWTSSKGPVTFTFPSLGAQTVRLIDSNACGLDSTTITVNINRSALAGFTAAPIQGCQPLVVNFTDTSVGLAIIHTWNFGDPASGGANTSSATNPVHTFNNPGTYTVSLTASNLCPPSSLASRTIKVFAKPVVAIGGATSGCVPHTVNLVNNTINLSPAAQLLWDFGGGDTTSAPTPSARVFNTPGSYPVKLKVTDTCGTDSATVVINVSTIPVAAFSATTMCRGDSTVFTEGSTLAPGDVVTAYKWYFGDGDSSAAFNPKHLYASQGSYQAVLRITTDKTCFDTDTQTVTVKASPVVGFVNTPASICDGQAVSFDGTVNPVSGSITAYQWTFGTTDTAHVEDTSYLFPSAGNYVVKYKAENSIGCSTTLLKNITVNPLPDSKFTSGAACYGQATRFFDSSTVGNANTITQWAWDFNNDGTPDSLTANPAFFFPASGSFNVKLTVGTNHNCFNTDSVLITVSALPVVHISAGAGSLCKLDSFTFNNTTTGAISYTWRFGDTAAAYVTSSAASFKKAYTDTGQFAVRMTATTSSGCKDSGFFSVFSRPLPVAKFTTNDTVSCAPKTFTFTNQSLLAGQYSWSVNNIPTTGSINRPDTTVSLSGQDLLVSLVAMNSFGCRPDTVSKHIVTIANPTPDFTVSADSGCGPLGISFNNISSNALSYQWKLGNGKDTTQVHPSAVYAASQTIDTIYTVKLVALNGPGCKDSITRTVKVFPKPTSAYTQTLQNGCGPLPVAFSNASVHKSSGTISDMTFNWSFGNGVTSSAKDPAVPFVASLVQDTIYPVRLIAFSKYGCSDTATSQVRVFPNAKAVFTSNTAAGCGPLGVGFTNSSVPNDTGHINIMSFAWDFRNGTTSTTVHPAASYMANAVKDTIYDVQLIAFSEHGCPDTTYHSVRVYPKPLSAFKASDTAGCGPLAVSFTNQSVPHDTGSINIMSFIWSFGNGLNSIGVHPSMQYLAKILADTTYHVNLVAFSEHGCLDTSHKDIVVHPKPFVGFTANKTQGCGPLGISFTNTTLLGSAYQWKFGDGHDTTSLHAQHTFESYDLVDSVYTVSLSAASAFGCQGDTATTTIITRYNPVADFISSADSICGTGPVSFYNASSGSVASAWDFGNGNASTAINPLSSFTALVAKDTTYDVTLIVRSPYNCRDTVSKPVKVNVLPDASFATVAPGCPPLNVVFNNTSQRAVQHEWDFGDATGSVVPNPGKAFDNPVVLVNRVFPVTLKVYSSSGCTDTAKRNITVYPKPLPVFSANKTQRCDTTSFNMLNTTIGAAVYAWSFGDGKTDNAFSPLHYYRTSSFQDTAYLVRLTATTTDGCKDSTDRTVTAHPLVHAVFTSGTTSSCENLHVQFANASGNAANYFWTFGDGSGSTANAPAHQYTNTGTYKVTLVAFDASGCSDTAEKPNYVNVFEVPKANFLVTPQPTALPDATLQFKNISFISSGTLNYDWSFGDPASPGNTSAQKDPGHTFSDSGNYAVRLIVTSSFNCTDTMDHPVRIEPHPPLASFSYDPGSGCMPFTVTFTNNSQYAGQYSWNFGDAANAQEKDPVHTYQVPGTYNVFLRATGPGGIDDTTQVQIITVYPKPRANYIAAPLNLYLPDATVELANTSYDAVKSRWTLFKDPDGSPYWEDSSTNSAYHFNEEGIFSVRLIVMSPFGCLDTMMRDEKVSVYKGGTIFVPGAFTPNGDQRNEVFIPVHTGVVPEKYVFSIYDRWGQKVFETDQVSEGWNGSIRGEPAVTETYIWIVQGTFVGGDEFTRKGQVTLLR